LPTVVEQRPLRVVLFDGQRDPLGDVVAGQALDEAAD
jgi:hypothetical protein